MLCDAYCFAASAALAVVHNDNEDCSYLELFPSHDNEENLQLKGLKVKPRYCNVKLNQLHIDLR